jgi:hypothetical protein
MIRVDGNREDKVIKLIEEHGFYENEEQQNFTKDILVSGNKSKMSVFFPQSHINTVDIHFETKDRWMSFSIPGQVSIDDLLYAIDKLVLNIDAIYIKFEKKRSTCKGVCFHHLCTREYLKCFGCGNVIDLSEY